MDRVVELRIPARPEFVGIARMAVAALAGVRPGLAYERIDDLRIVVSEACTSAIEALSRGGASGDAAHLVLRCHDGPKSLEIRIEAPAGAFEGAVPAVGSDVDVDDAFRISLIRALVDDAELRTATGGAELCLVMHREANSEAANEEPGDLPA